MGTRNLTMVISNGETKIAQYGQWDGYPKGQGYTVFDFLNKIIEYKQLDALRERVAKLRFLKDGEQTTIDESPWMSRDLGADILNAVMYGEFEESDYRSKRTVKCDVNVLQDNAGFMKDGLFCEWAYVIDLDKSTLAVCSGGEKPIKTYSFDKLPKKKETFANQLNKIVENAY